jgi:N-acetylglucosamine-6-phosphate deacetylase
MSTLTLAGPRLFTGEEWRENAYVSVQGGIIVSVSEAPPKTGTLLSLPADYLLVPGFIDAQVNGGGGVLFNDTPDGPTLKRIAAAHRRFGTTAFLPTLISDTRAKMRAALQTVRKAIDAEIPGIVGLHLEGPFLSPAKHGAHAADVITALTEADVAWLSQPFPGTLVLTLAPEEVHDPSFLTALHTAGVVLAAGHSAASYEQAMTGFDSGISGVTHLFNAMTPLSARAPGLIGALLDHPDTWAGIIADGVHVHPVNLRLALRLLGPKRLLLVTDAMPPVGSSISRFTLGGQKVEVRGGACVNENGGLAGSVLDMASAVRTMVSQVGASLSDALRMASTTPAERLGLYDRGRIAPGFRADMVALTLDLTAARVWIGGRED